jgi:hypothetical protein
MSVQLREIPLPLQKNAAYYTPSPPQKQVARKPSDRLLNHSRYVKEHISENHLS